MYIYTYIMYVYHVCHFDSTYGVSQWDNTKHNAIYGNTVMYLVCLLTSLSIKGSQTADGRQVVTKLSTAHYNSVMSHTKSSTGFYFRNSEFTFIQIVFLQCIIFSVN